jgi:hypothetical protein
MVDKLVLISTHHRINLVSDMTNIELIINDMASNEHRCWLIKQLTYRNWYGWFPVRQKYWSPRWGWKHTFTLPYELSWECVSMWVLCCSTSPYVSRAGSYIGTISRHMTVWLFQSSPSERQLWRLMSCMYFNVTSCMIINGIKCHNMTLKTPNFETGPSK